MKEQEASVNSITEQKAKIRLRYQGIDPNLLVVLPAKTETGLYDDTVHRRVAVYARVSTDDPHQTSSYELQKNYYELCLTAPQLGTCRNLCGRGYFRYFSSSS